MDNGKSTMRHVVVGADLRYCLAKERAERKTVQLKLQLAQTALKLERTERAGDGARLAQREEEVSAHLGTSLAVFSTERSVCYDGSNGSKLNK